jgi:hypothetical protein
MFTVLRFKVIALAALVIALAACSGPAPRKPARGAPAQRVQVPDLNERGGAQLWQQLRQFSSMPGVCRRVLSETDGIAFSPLADMFPSPKCGYRNAVRLQKTVVPLDRTLDVSCPMAAALHLWMRDVVQPAARLHLEAKVTRIETFGSYACRNRNNQAGGRLSEHATANALDVSGFMLGNGRKLMVLEGWRGSPADAAFLKAVHRQSCKHFSVVIGPDGDRFHYNHLHFDMGPWRSCK